MVKLNSKFRKKEKTIKIQIGRQGSPRLTLTSLTRTIISLPCLPKSESESSTSQVNPLPTSQNIMERSALGPSSSAHLIILYSCHPKGNVSNTMQGQASTPAPLNNYITRAWEATSDRQITIVFALSSKTRGTTAKKTLDLHKYHSPEALE